ncbi:16S rRNA (guanine(527)-N(7))-methyltransferase RsmG [Desulfurivibrio alkaliphilus]|uniref:Ribosomal RNA small subunit methyltransferase G n=1 Tax=Desulfurivibrio alkaliphilus (strain DSM 19089 / UNIQEM U267 / AHT2) TaxID=589865 RepID=D6Z6C3_DESAT|nr:16S rRNA (guanine(527)-N(7))-methyltransferase RsmG [Desulfurivibrio alkaliphilus]ADH86888.1 methyltransferase GidB [Desulfurivibrio alkaliphilus AHT 2]
MNSGCADILAEGLQQLGLPPEPAAIARLCRYHEELLKWSRRINLVAAAPPRELLATHFLDSLTLWPLLADLPVNDHRAPPLAAIKPAHKGTDLISVPDHPSPSRLQQPALAGDCSRLSLLDVGTGAGFPGLALKCWRPEALAVTLMEPRAKRVSFLRHVIRTLKLQEGTQVLAQRLEPVTDSQEAPADRFALITSRAFTAIAPFLALCAPLSPPGGRVICMKGPKAEAELAAWRRQQPDSPYSLEQSATFTLPFTAACRTLLVFRKAEL